MTAHIDRRESPGRKDGVSKEGSEISHADHRTAIYMHVAGMMVMMSDGCCWCGGQSLQGDRCHEAQNAGAKAQACTKMNIKTWAWTRYVAAEHLYGSQTTMRTTACRVRF